MRKSPFTEAQIIGMIKEQEAGMATAEVCLRQRSTSSRPSIAAWTCPMPKAEGA